MLVTFLISWANSILSPTVLVPVYDPTKSTQKFPFLCIFTSMLSFVCLITDNIRGMKGYLIAILTCIALSVCDVQHLFMHQLDVYVFSLEKCLFRLFAHFLIEMDFFFFGLSCKNSLYILDMNPLSNNVVWKYFFPFSRLTFNFVDSFLRCLEVSLFIFAFVSFPIVVESKINCQERW